MSEIMPEGKYTALGAMLGSKFTQFASDREVDEARWLKASRQVAGEYDPSVKIDANRSSAYPRITRMKCRSIIARLMHLMFQATDKNWTLECTPIPELHPEDEATVIETLMSGAQPGAAPASEEVEEAIKKFAQERAANQERLIEDELTTAAGGEAGGYDALVKRVLTSGVQYGLGVMHGPMVQQVKARVWQRDGTGALTKEERVEYRPQYEFVPIWNYYYDAAAPDFASMTGQFQRFVLNKQQLLTRAKDYGMDMAAVKQYIKDNPKGDHEIAGHESDRSDSTDGSQTRPQLTDRYDLLLYTGYIADTDAVTAGLIEKDAAEGQDVPVMVYMCGHTVLKAEVNPWYLLDPNSSVQMYHHFVFEESESSLAGVGLPEVIRDTQLTISNATRMLLDNLGSIAGPMAEVNIDLLHATQLADPHIRPYKTWLRTGQGMEAQIPAVREIKFDSHAGDIMNVIQWFSRFADDEAMTQQSTTGDSQRGPGEAFRTAAGASMLHGDMALPFKDIVRSFDAFTKTVISALVHFNKHFVPDPKYRGDAVVVCKGATSLIAKEVRGIMMDTLATTLTPEDAMFVDRYELLKQRLQTRDADFGTILCSDEEAKRRKASAAEQAQQAAAKQEEMLTAQIREILTQSFKNLTQGDKNSANADATVLNAALKRITTEIEVNAAATERDDDEGGGQGASGSSPVRK